jgi:hypothetical protein
MDKKIEKTIIVKSSVEDDRTITCVGSVEKIDRDNDVVVIQGVDIKNYKDNPIVLWAHDQKSLPIAKATKVF